MHFRLKAVKALSLFPLLAFALPNQSDLPASAHEKHEYDLLKVRWEVSFDPAKGSLSGEVTNSVKSSFNGAALIFDCAKLEVLETTINGKKARFSSNGKTVAVQPEKPLRKGESAEVTIKYRGEPEAGVYFVPAKRAFPGKGDIVYTQGEMIDNRYWLPTYDWPDDKASSEGIIHVPKGWKALSNGRLVEVTTRANEDVWHWRNDQPHSTYLISFVAGDYSILPDGKGDTTVTNWVPKGLDEWGNAAFGGTSPIVDFYGKLTGFRYPWAKYSQSAVPDFMFGGMENVTCTTQTINAIFPPSVGNCRDATDLVAHELAHQWFGDTVTAPSWSHIWINEGWATFLPPFWHREKQGENAYDLARLGVFNGGLSAHLSAPTRSMIFEGYKEPIDMFDSFAYPGGASRMFMLMHELGEDKFWPAIKDYLRSNEFKNVDTEGFFRSVEKTTGRNLDAFRKQWFYTAAAPDLTLTRVNGRLSVVQKGHVFEIPLEIGVLDANGRWSFQTVNLSKETTALDVPASTLVLLDPKVWLMGPFKYEDGYTAADWRRLYENAPNVAQRSRLLDQVVSSSSVEGLIAVAKTERSVELLQRLIPSIRDEKFLLDMTQNADARLVQSALGAMDQLTPSDNVMERLKQVAKSTRNDELKAAAYQSWINLQGDDQLATKLYAMDSYDESLRIMALRWWVTKDPNKAREVCLDALKNPPSEPVRLSAIRHLGELKDKPGERRVFEALAAMMAERSNSPLRAAIGALGAYGDKAAIPLLEKRANHSLHFVRRDVEAALAKLR